MRSVLPLGQELKAFSLGYRKDSREIVKCHTTEGPDGKTK